MERGKGKRKCRKGCGEEKDREVKGKGKEQKEGMR